MGNYELPVSEAAYNKVRTALHGNGFAMFKVIGIDNAVFALAHGNKDGLIDVKGHTMCPSLFLKEAVQQLKLVDKGIDIVYTLSCYGGLQKQSTFMGVEIKSCHPSIQEIQVRAMPLLEGYVVEVTA